jgi:exopolyphosphatase / guanosine-5'-triphosphate,3'-diphosphate pyrophosphatase
LRIAAIEIGTNSTKFLNVEVRNGSYEIIEKSSIINRLSSGMYGGGRLSAEHIENTVQIIGDYLRKVLETNSKLISIFATSVLRDAKDRNLLVEKINDLYGVTIEIISGEQEARLAFKGCRNLLKDRPGNSAVIDIGGGSTELTIGNETMINHRLSLNIGAVRLTEIFVRNDPALQTEINEMKRYIRRQLGNHAAVSGLTGLVGVGGTIKTVGTIFNRIDYNREADVNGLLLSKDKIETIYHHLTSLKLDQRKALIGLHPKRADVIIAGITILLEIMRHLSTPEITVSSQGVIEGYLEEFMAGRC